MYNTEILSNIIAKWIVWLIIVGVCVLVYFLSLKVRRIQYRWAFFLVPGLIAVSLIIFSIHGFTDISQELYITEYVEYNRYEALGRRSIIPDESVQITDSNGKTIVLIGADDDFPYGNFNGTVTYAQRSKIILDFVSD